MKSEYFYEGGLLRYEKRGNTELYFRYNGNGHLAAIQHYDNSGTANSYYVTTNFQGDVVGLYSGSGELLVSYEYDEWGNATINNPSGLAIAELNPIRYRGYYYDSETGLYYLQSRYYDPEICRFLNADNQLNSDMLGCNVYAYCSNNSVNCSDPTGHAWYHWAIGAAIVAACAVAVVATAGGIAPAIAAVASVANGMAAATTASTIAAGAFVSSATVYGTLAVSAAMCSTSVSDFNEQGDWGTVAATAGSAVLGGGSAYVATRTPTTKVYRSVSNAEAQDIKTTGQFNLAPGGMESKQFGFNLAETRQFGNMMSQNTIVSAKVPTNTLNQFYTGGVDTSIFRSGTLTVYGDQLVAFNQAVGGTIKFMP